MKNVIINYIELYNRISSIFIYMIQLYLQIEKKKKKTGKNIPINVHCKLYYNF